MDEKEEEAALDDDVRVESLGDTTGASASSSALFLSGVAGAFSGAGAAASVVALASAAAAS